MNIEQIEQQNLKGRFSSLKIWAKLLPFLKPYSKTMVVIVVLMLVGAACDIAYPLLSGYAVDQFVTPATSEGVTWFALGYFAVVFLQMLSTMIFARAALKVEMYLGRDLKKKLFIHLQTLSFSYYNTTPVGTIMARVMSDTNKIGTVFAWSLVDIFWSAAYVLGSMVVMRWAIRMVVPWTFFRMDWRIFASVSMSTAERESSNTLMGVSCISIRAIATRCFCPPEMVTPRSPMGVS